MNEKMTDLRVVYGATCAWWDTIDKIATTDSGLPCCPHCKGVLFEMDNEEEWWKGVNKYEKAGHPNYRVMIRWLRGKCFPTFDKAQEAFLGSPPRRTRFA